MSFNFLKSKVLFLIGAVIFDSVTWNMNLCRVFSNLIDNTIQNQQRANKTKVVKTLKITDDLVELAALVAR